MATKTKLKKIFDNIEEDKKTIVDDLINNAIYMSGLLSKLKTEINKNGVIGYTATGNITESPLVRSYNNLLKNYSSIINQLIRYLPPSVKSNSVDELTKFLNG
ncbi:MAG: hypothetical protein PHV07_01610 [Oscillospiraceae bacterium]|nr:hypothetical protein [Oscillospiraceae bacterium]